MKITYLINNEESIYYFKERNAIKNFLNSPEMNGKNIILKFSAKWCGPCNYSTKQLEKLLDDLNNDAFSVPNVKELENCNDIIIIDIDVDKYDNIASYFRIKTLPTIVTYFNGDVELVRNSIDYNGWISLFKVLH